MPITATELKSCYNYHKDSEGACHDDSQDGGEVTKGAVMYY